MGRSRNEGRRAIRLRLTPLEDRTLPASGIVASLSSGILRITDRMPTDAVIVHQTPAGVPVPATDTNLSYQVVTRVTMDVQNNDTVTNDVSALGTTSAREVYLNRRDATGRTFVFGGDLAAGAT